MPASVIEAGPKQPAAGGQLRTTRYEEQSRHGKQPGRQSEGRLGEGRQSEGRWGRITHALSPHLTSRRTGKRRPGATPSIVSQASTIAQRDGAGHRPDAPCPAVTACLRHRRPSAAAIVVSARTETAGTRPRIGGRFLAGGGGGVPWLAPIAIDTPFSRRHKITTRAARSFLHHTRPVGVSIVGVGVVPRCGTSVGRRRESRSLSVRVPGCGPCGGSSLRRLGGEIAARTRGIRRRRRGDRGSELGT